MHTCFEDGVVCDLDKFSAHITEILGGTSCHSDSVKSWRVYLVSSDCNMSSYRCREVMLELIIRADTSCGCIPDSIIRDEYVL